MVEHYPQILASKEKATTTTILLLPGFPRWSTYEGEIQFDSSA